MVNSNDARSAQGRAAREKGKRGEREVAQRFRDAGFKDARRTAQFCGKTGDAADVVGVPRLHIEVKRVEREAVRKWIAQAVRDAEAGGEGKIPVVVHRKSGDPWLVTLRLEDFLDMYKETNNG